MGNNRTCGSAGDAVYGLGFIGAAIYFISTATGFWMGVLGVLKAIVWPAYLVYLAFQQMLWVIFTSLPFPDIRQRNSCMLRHLPDSVCKCVDGIFLLSLSFTGSSDQRLPEGWISLIAHTKREITASWLLLRDGYSFRMEILIVEICWKNVDFTLVGKNSSINRNALQNILLTWLNILFLLQIHWIKNRITRIDFYLIQPKS